MDLSILSLSELVSWIKKSIASHGWDYEVIMVDDGSTDQSWNTIVNLKKESRNSRYKTKT